MSAFFEAGGGSGTVNILKRKGLSYYVHGEFEHFKIFLKHHRGTKYYPKTLIFYVSDAVNGPVHSDC